MAQFQAEYQAYRNAIGHDGPSRYFDPVSGKTVNMYDMSDRAKFFGVESVVEAAGQGSPGDFPHGWMKSETHFRPWFNVDGCYPEIGYGAAKSSSGSWYFVAVPVRDADCSKATPEAPTATDVPAAATEAPAAAATVAPAAAATVAPVAEATVAPVVEEVATPAAAATGFPIPAGTTIVQEQKYPSESGNHYLVYQPDGNVVVYDKDDNFVWGLNLVSDRYADVKQVLMQPDGNFALYGDTIDDYVWSALNADPDASAFLHLTPEGVLQLVSGDSRRIMWSSDGNLDGVVPTAVPTVAPTEVPSGEATPEPPDEVVALPVADANATVPALEQSVPVTDDTTAAVDATPCRDATGATTDTVAAEATPVATLAPNVSSVSDGAGNVYDTVKIGDQIWMAENLRAAVCNDGSPIPFIADADEWLTQTGPAYTWATEVMSDTQGQRDYGAFYNNYAALLSCNICPADLRVPSAADFQTLLESQGADAHLKLSDPAFWGTGSLATNESGWNPRPAGGQGGDLAGSYDFGAFAYYWSTTEPNPGTNNLFVVHAGDASPYGIASPRYGFSVRCMTDATPPAPATVDASIVPTTTVPATSTVPATDTVAVTGTAPIGTALVTFPAIPDGVATCENIPAASAGNVRVRLNNTTFGGQDVYLFYTGTAAAPVAPVLHAIVRIGSVKDIEAPDGTTWELRTHFGTKVGSLTASTQKPCVATPLFRIRQSVNDNEYWASGFRTVCNTISPLPGGDVTVRFTNSRNPSRFHRVGDGVHDRHERRSASGSRAIHTGRWRVQGYCGGIRQPVGDSR